LVAVEEKKDTRRLIVLWCYECVVQYLVVLLASFASSGQHDVDATVGEGSVDRDVREAFWDLT
jgi:hypothetical protein